jgi:hypothetical protein
VTASTVDKAYVLSSDQHLDLWVNIFKELIAEFKVKLTAWVVLPNHYHFLFLPVFGYDLGVFMKRLNGRTSYESNSLDQRQDGRFGIVIGIPALEANMISGRALITSITIPSSMDMCRTLKIGISPVIAIIYAMMEKYG